MKKMGSQHKIDLPTPYRELIERVSQEDKAWFVAHPGVTDYERDYVSGESWPTFPNCTRVLVVRITDEFRARAFQEPGFDKKAVVAQLHRMFAHMTEEGNAQQ